MDPVPSDPRGHVVSDPDLGAAARLMNETWTQPCWKYSESMLADYVRRPSGDRALTVGWKRDSRLLGFFAGVPIDVETQAGRHKAIFTSFMTAHPDAKSPGMTVRLFSDVVATARARGAVHIYTVFHHDQETNRFVRRLFQLCAAPAQDLLEFKFLMRPLGLGALPQSHATVVPYEPRWLDKALALVTKVGSVVPLAQVYDAQDLQAILASEHSLTRVLLDGEKVRALVIGRRREVLSRRAARHLHLDFLAMDALSAKDQDLLLTSVASAATEEGIDALVAPDLGYFDAGALLRNGFIRFTSQGVLAVAPLVPHAPRVERVRGAFIEVY